uniref:Uncharacterized protein n=1 Tax=Rhizophora mucronata TaxID=61149 RepID=A0A2P2PXS7_RHIMU
MCQKPITNAGNMKQMATTRQQAYFVSFR